MIIIIIIFEYFNNIIMKLSFIMIIIIFEYYNNDTVTLLPTTGMVWYQIWYGTIPYHSDII